MEGKMCSVTVLSIILVFVGDVWTGTLQHKDVSPRKCHHCIQNATTNCQMFTEPPVLCPTGQPYCATVANAPNFTSSLTCASARQSPCLLTFNSKLELEMHCICTEQLCNLPYSAQLRHELINFSSELPPNTTDFTGLFLKLSTFSNVTVTELYKAMTEMGDPTDAVKDLPQSATHGIISIDVSEAVPHAEALKHEATVPPDDEEDDGEGSGSLEEIKTQAAPAAPSSYLPAEENRATSTKYNVHLILCTIFYISKEIL